MGTDSNKKKITLTEEQAARAAEAVLNGWLRNDETNTNHSKKKKNRW